jgi:hypothetical protein
MVTFNTLNRQRKKKRKEWRRRREERGEEEEGDELAPCGLFPFCLLLS